MLPNDQTSMLDIHKPIIDAIEKIVDTIPGWTPIDQLYTLFTLAYTSSSLPGDLLEIGSWCGRSSVVLGTAARLAGGSRLACIDLYPDKNDWAQNSDGTYSFQVTIDGVRYGGYQDQTVWQEPFEKEIAPIYQRYNSVYDVFVESIRKYDLEDLVEAYRGSSDLLRGFEGRAFRLAFIDGDHSYKAVCNDIRNVKSLLVPGGWVCLDDAFSYYQGVNAAIKDLIIDNPEFDLYQQMTRKFFVARKRKNIRSVPAQERPFNFTAISRANSVD